MLRRDAVGEAELIEILRESSPDQRPLLSNFEAIPALAVHGLAALFLRQMDFQ